MILTRDGRWLYGMTIMAGMTRIGAGIAAPLILSIMITSLKKLISDQ